MNNRIVVSGLAAMVLLLAGCGAAETAEQIKQGKETQAKIEEYLAAAQLAAADARAAADSQ